MSILADEIYTVTVTEPNGCTSIASGHIDMFPISDPFIAASPDICVGQEELDLQEVLPFVSYQWNTGETAPSITVDGVGTYALTVTDANGCTSTAAQAIVAAPMPLPSIPAVPAACNGGAQQLSVSGGPFETYAWSTGANTGNITVNQAGTYAVTVSNARGCTASTSVAVNLGTAPTAAISTSANACNGSATLTATGGVGYQWSTGATTASIGTTTSGPYTVTVTNAAGCTATSSVSASIPPPPQVQVSGPGLLCQGSTATLTATSGFTSYLWSNGATSASIPATQSASYTVTATDAAGCTATAAFPLSFEPLPTSNIVGQASFCSGSSTDLLVNGDFSSCIWSNGSTATTITVAQPGLYTVTVTNAQGCTATNAQAVTVGAGLSPAIAQATVGCSGIATLDAGSGFANYLWSNGETSSSISTANAGNYSVTVSDMSGCTGSAASNLVFPPPPIAAINGPSSACAGTTATLDASAGFANYLWSTGETTASIAAGQSGSYAVTVTDAAGCTATASQQFSSLSAPTVSLSGPASICASSSAVLVASGNFAQANWSTGDTGNSVFVSQPATYLVTVTDAAGCTATASQGLSVLAPPILDITGPPSICIGNNATLVASGNFAQATWNTGETTPSISASQPGNYAVTVTDANGCTASASQQLTVNSSLSPTIAAAVQPCISTATLNAGPGFTSYLWSNGAVTPTISVSQTGNYAVTVGDGSGCTGNDVMAVAFPNLPQVDILGTTSICTGGSAVFTTSSSFPQAIWSTGETTASITASQPGNYTVTITDANGCTAIASQTLSVGTSLLPQIASTNSGCNGTATLNAGAGYSSYLWSNGATTPTISVGQAGSYSVTVSDASGCSGQATQAVAFPTPPQVQVVGPIAFCANSSVQLSISGNFPLVNWNTGSTSPTITASQPGDYSVTITDANGCTATASQALTATQPPTPNVAATNIGCDGTATLVGGGSFASYLWSNGAVTPTISVGQSGNYSVTVTDASGCTGVDMLPLTLPAPPQVGIVGPAQLCEGYTQTLVASSGFAGYLWSTGVTLPQITIVAGGQYGLTVTDGSGCTATAAWSVMELPTQFSNIQVQTCSLQDTGTVVITLTSLTGCDSVVTVATVLNPTLTASLAMSACPGGYASFNGVQILAGNSQDFIFTGSNGCDSVLTVQVDMLPAVAFDWEASPSCWNQSDGSVTLATSAGTAPFRFAMDGGTQMASPIFTGLAPGSHQVMVLDANGCAEETMVEVPATERTVIVLEDAPLHCGEATAVLSPKLLSGSAQAVAWHWSNGAVTQNLQASSGSFTLTADDGCEVQSLTATVLPDDSWNRDYFYVPDSFSPNGDGINDLFMAFSNPAVEVRSFEFRVFDRWGDAVYTATEANAPGWEGIRRGGEMQGAVFGWFLKATVGGCTGADLEVFQKGGVTIVR